MPEIMSVIADAHKTLTDKGFTEDEANKVLIALMSGGIELKRERVPGAAYRQGVRDMRDDRSVLRRGERGFLEGVPQSEVFGG